MKTRNGLLFFLMFGWLVLISAPSVYAITWQGTALVTDGIFDGSVGGNVSSAWMNTGNGGWNHSYGHEGQVDMTILSGYTNPITYLWQNVSASQHVEDCRHSARRCR